MQQMESVIFSEKLRESGEISHAFFGKKSGSSTGLFSSLNCSKYVGDNEESVKKNLEIVRKNLGASAVVTLNQCHSKICIGIINEKKIESDMKADAIVTNIKGIALGILTADCVPILFYDRTKKIIGAAHAGWRGAFSGVIESTIQKMESFGSCAKDIVVALGPSIDKNSYEIEQEFMEKFSGNGDCFCISNGRMCFDLPKFCRKKLIESGILENNIDVLNVDTYTNNDDYFSYRFAKKNLGGICGRQISVICLV